MNIRLNDPMISGTVQLTDPDALRLTRADVSLNLGGARMRIAATPYYGGFRVQPLDGYTDLTGALSLVSPLMDAATAKTATFDVALGGPMRLSGTATVTRTSGGYDAALTTSVDGVTVTAEYIGGTVYVSARQHPRQRHGQRDPGARRVGRQARRCERSGRRGQRLRAVFPRAHAAVRRRQHPRPDVVEQCPACAAEHRGHGCVRRPLGRQRNGHGCWLDGARDGHLDVRQCRCHQPHERKLCHALAAAALCPRA